MPGIPHPPRSQDAKCWRQTARPYILEQDLLELKNAEWLDVGEQPVSRAQFRKSLKLSAIEVRPDGSFECIFTDGGLFDGHDLVVRGNLKSGSKQADLQG